MIVFRLEHGTVRDPLTGLGCGPHCGRREVLEFLREGDKDCGELEEAFEVLSSVMYSFGGPNRWTPMADPELQYIRSYEVCGLNTLEALHGWFDRAVEALLRCGYVISKYEVPDDKCRIGHDGQTLFEYAHAVRVNDSEDANV